MDPQRTPSTTAAASSTTRTPPTQPTPTSTTRRAHFVENEPEIIPTPSRAKPRRQGPGRRGGGAGKKADAEDKTPGALFWDDDGREEADKYTLYREETPTPPDEEHQKAVARGEKTVATAKAATLSSLVAAEAAIALGPRAIDDGGFPFPRHNHDSNHGLASGFDPESENGSSHRSAAVCGLRRWVFWVLVVAAVFLLVGLGLSVGLGVGLAKTIQKGSGKVAGTAPSATATAAGTAASDAPESSSPASSTATSSSSAATSTTSSITGCPNVNSTTCTAPNSTTTFLRVCGIDYSGTGGATDLAHVETGTMDDCMDSCAAYAGCTGCGWGYIANDTGSAHRCWLKSGLGEPHEALPDWIFGVLQG